MKDIIKKIPVINRIARRVYSTLIYPLEPFPGSEEYWKHRYKSGGTSGAGSQNALAEFKAEVLNNFISEFKINTVIEYGCGDGSQLKLAEYPLYIGFEISEDAIESCKKLFSGDSSKSFKLMSEYEGELAQITISLDVIYHLVEEDVFSAYMERLLGSSLRFVIIYSSDTDVNRKNQAHHIKNRKFSEWIGKTHQEWKLIRHIPNRFPFKDDVINESWSEFYIYEKNFVQG
jgi:hypothetical protein